MDNPIHQNMTARSETVSDQQQRLTVSVPANQVSQRVASRLRQIAKTAKVPGFRPGKVPMSRIQSDYGYSVQEEIMDELIRETLFRAVEQEKIRFVGMPQIEKIEQQDGQVVYTALLERFPQVELKPFSELQVEKVTGSVQDNDVQEMIEQLRKQHQTFTPKTEAAASGDRVTIDFKGRVDGELFEGGSAEGQSLILGSGRMIPGFEAGIEGMQPGETKTIDVTFPEDYQAENLKGKPAQFEITLQQLESAQLPELDDELARKFGIEEGGIEKLRQDVRNNMDREVRQAIRMQNRDRVMDALLATHEFDVPEALVKEEIERLKRRFAEQFASQFGGNFDPSTLPANLFNDEMFRGDATRDAKLRVIMTQILEGSKLEVDQARVDQFIEEMAQSYEDPQEVIDYYRSNPDMRAQVEDTILEDQLIDYITQDAQVTEQTQGYQDLLKNRRGAMM